MSEIVVYVAGSLTDSRGVIGLLEASFEASQQSRPEVMLAQMPAEPSPERIAPREIISAAIAEEAEFILFATDSPEAVTALLAPLAEAAAERGIEVLVLRPKGTPDGYTLGVVRCRKCPAGRWTFYELGDPTADEDKAETRDEDPDPEATRYREATGEELRC